jgi:biotin carboxyl carrier protein
VRREVTAEIAGSVWSHVAAVGQQVKAKAVLLVTECMKTEIPVESPVAGTVVWLLGCAESVELGTVVAILEVP